MLFKTYINGTFKCNMFDERLKSYLNWYNVNLDTIHKAMNSNIGETGYTCIRDEDMTGGDFEIGFSWKRIK